MTTFLVSSVVLGLAVLAMSVGVMFGRAPISGSCGGVAGRCAVCSRGTCKRKHAEAASSGEGTT